VNVNGFSRSVSFPLQRRRPPFLGSGRQGYAATVAKEWCGAAEVESDRDQVRLGFRKGTIDMKKKTSEEANDDLRPHYDFDYSKMKPNRFADREKLHKQTYVALDEDVSEVFQTSEAVNTVLRSAIKAMRTASQAGSEKR
jgi:hypothetical protein